MTRVIEGIRWEDEVTVHGTALTKLKIREVSGVRNPASVTGFAVIKSADAEIEKADDDVEEFVSTLADMCIAGIERYKDDRQTLDRVCTILQGALNVAYGTKDIGHATEEPVVYSTEAADVVKSALSARAKARGSGFLPGEQVTTVRKRTMRGG